MEQARNNKKATMNDCKANVNYLQRLNLSIRRQKRIDFNLFATLGLMCLILCLLLFVPTLECKVLRLHPSDWSPTNGVAKDELLVTHRVRRQATGDQPQQQQQLELSEQNLKRQLPDLIAQAYQDKQMERALLRLLISASLRSGLGGSGNVASANNRPLPANWQDGDNMLIDGASSESISAHPRQRLQQQQQQQGETIQESSGDPEGRLAGVEVSSLLASIDQLNAGQLQALEQSQGGQQYSAMDKREYIKPCSFNAISCVRTPFRKL